MTNKLKLAFVAAAASAAMVASAADAGTFVTSITITSAIPSYLQIAELEAFSNGVDVASSANGATAVGSSVYSAFSTADKAIDGNTGGNYYTDTIFHSAGSGPNEYLTVTLANGGADISSLSIFGRTDCCGDRDIYKYSFLNAAGDVVGGGTLNATRGSATAAVPEIATWGMMLAGFGMIGFAARRRQLVKTFVSFA